MKNIAILGGSFDPIHNGHLIAAQCVYDTDQFDELWVMPTGNPPHKELKISNSKHKIEMCTLAIEGMDGFKVSDYELNRKEKVYSVHTFENLSHSFSNVKFWLIIGADSLLYLEKWYDAEKLLTIGNFVVVDRGGIDPEKTKSQLEILRKQYEAEFMFVKMPLIELSSTNIRNRIQHNQSILHRVPKSVVDYIHDKGLYR